MPGLAQIPLLGKLFAARNDTRTTTELVIFLRPTVIRSASLEGDYAALRPLLPDEKFLEAPRLDNFFGAEQTLPALPAP